MKTIFFIILIIGLTILFGTFPLSILAKVFGYLETFFDWLANIITAIIKNCNFLNKFIKNSYFFIKKALNCNFA